MKDRQALLPNRIKISYDDGSEKYVYWEFADQPTETGTALNKDNLLSDTTVAAIGLTQEDPTPNDALLKLAALSNGAIQSTQKGEANGVSSLDTNAKVSANESSSTTITKIASHTLELTDAGKMLLFDVADENTVTIPLNETVAFPIGTEIEICQYGAGTVTIAAVSGVTIYSMDSAVATAGQYASVCLKKLGTDEWLLGGALG